MLNGIQLVDMLLHMFLHGLEMETTNIKYGHSSEEDYERKPRLDSKIRVHSCNNFSVAKTGPIRMAPANAIVANRQGLEAIEV